MRTLLDAKAMAKSLRESLARKSIVLSHSECLEIVAHELGYKEWNVLATKMGGGDGIALARAVPIVRIFDTDKAAEFYLGFLGFKRDWDDEAYWKERGGPLYSCISRDRCILHLSEQHGDASPGSNAFIPMRNIDAFHAELTGKNYPYNKPGIDDEPWGRTVQVHDPFGNRLRFCEYKKGRVENEAY